MEFIFKIRTLASRNFVWISIIMVKFVPNFYLYPRFPTEWITSTFKLKHVFISGGGWTPLSASEFFRSKNEGR